MILELLDQVFPLPPYNIMPAPIIRAKSFTSLKTYLRQDINNTVFNIFPKNEESNKYKMMEIYLQWITLIKWLGPISVLKTILRNTERSGLCTSTFYLCTSTYIIPFRPYAVNHLHGHAGLVARAAWQAGVVGVRRKWRLHFSTSNTWGGLILRGCFAQKKLRALNHLLWRSSSSLFYVSDKYSLGKAAWI